MKRLVNYGGLAGIGVGLVLLGYAYSAPPPLANALTFADFPLGEPRVVDLSAREDALEDLTPRERQDQMRDWLLCAVLSTSGLSATDINEALFDLPPIRHGYLQPVANFEYGATRSRHLGSGQVVALVPEGGADRLDQLARVADEHRKNLGEIPKTVWVFEYRLSSEDDADRIVTIVRRESLSGNELFTPAHGYHEATIAGRGDLVRFMGQVDDLTYASLNNGLTVGGRKITAHRYRGIRVEDVAAIYQSEAKIRETKGPVDRKIAEFEARWQSRRYRTELEKAQLELQYARETAELKEELRRLRGGTNTADSTGFSLDPAFDFAGLTEAFDSRIAPVIRTRNPVLASKFPAVRAALQREDPDPLFTLLGEAANNQENKTLARVIEQFVNANYGFQAARYDGDLQGTEAGMVLFYTDLLAKMWALDYQKSATATGATVDGFRPMTALPVSSVYKEEMEELSNTRLWFGPQDKGFQLTDSKRTMLFARTATRVYAASSNSLKPGIEAQANAHSSAFLGWWDDHYEEVSRYEQEYERLNEIMKWSLVVGWLNGEGHADKLAFLQQETVNRTNWFPDWVQRHPELRYRNWAEVAFYPRGHKGSRTEALPLLRSEGYEQFGTIHRLSGGVSLASEQTFARRTPLSFDTKVGQMARRANVDYAGSGGSSIKTLDGATYTFRNVNAQRAATTAVPKEGTKLRGAFAEVANKPLERSVTAEAGRVRFGARVGDIELGHLQIQRTRNGLSVGWHSRDLDLASALARRLSTSSDPAALLARDADAIATLVLPEDAGYIVQLGGSERWVKLTPERTSTANIAEGVQARVGDVTNGARNYNLTWVDAEQMASLIGPRKTVVVHQVQGTSGRYQMRVSAPSASGRSIELAGGSVRVRGSLDVRSGNVAFAYDDLPKNAKDDLGILNRMVAEARPSDRATRYVVSDKSTSRDVLREVRNGDYETAARDFAKSPKEFKARLDADLQDGLNDVRRLMADGHYEIASRRIDALTAVHGATDELRLHRVVADLSNSVPAHARESLRSLARSEGTRVNMLDEINARLSAAVTRPGESVRVARTGDEFVVRYSMRVPGDAAVLGRADIGRLKAYVYVQDTPGLNNLDWSVSLKQTLDGAVSGRFKAQVIKLPRGDVADFRPTVIFDDAQGVNYKAVTRTRTGTALRRPQLYQTGSGNSCHEQSPASSKGCSEDGDVYIVLVRG